ncbi:hypothetical protein CFC21_034682 [Triticum aestivum]|uniref:Uncharacterized protein n=3 Tax=Triticum TaxID=4564 RepID=A0A9R0VJQ0_TRITD|nr:uncharacterized protein LOC119267566 isoform X3 [Triticum dicoccoides]XP_044339424.1 uncharacterized protein LOC123060676 isoform X3 [Triticum aestivum]KAF7021791.1 hypothetical protein CFC21_034682 [Triticum aestivum]VAH58962.1 unnamed protein product [Triticum turgidum subsp. durum]
MARGLDSDYIGSISLMDGFDMGITFDGFGENMKKFMELPIKYLDSAHDKAVELVEDIHALIYAHSPDDKFPDKDHGTLTDPSSNGTITESPSTCVKMQQVNPNEEFSGYPSSLVTAEDHSLGSTATDVHETESVSSTSPAMCASEDPISLERTADTKEEVTFCNSEDLSDNCTPENHNSLGGSDSSDEEIILWNQWNSVTSRQYPEQATVVQDYISEEANGNKIIEQVELHGSGHSVAFDGAILLGKVNGEEQSELCSANSHEESTKHDLRVGQELMKYNKADASSVPQPKNTSFKKVLMRSLSNKLRWSKKDMNVHQAVPFRPQKSVDICYEVVCSSDGLEDDWELL